MSGYQTPPAETKTLTQGGTIVFSGPYTAVRLTLSPASGPPGTAVTASGTGFSPGSTVTITGFGQTPATVVSDSTGSWSVAFTVPAVSASAYLITATDRAGNQATSTFTITPTGATGTFLRKWGTTGSGDGQFINPSGIVVDGAGNVYVADRGNYRVQEFR